MKLAVVLFSVLLSARFYAQSVKDTIPPPDYRYHRNIPEYNPGLMPLSSPGRTATGVWTELNPKVPRVDYLGTGFANKDTGFACGANGALIKTTDGGEHWKTIAVPTTSPILKVRSIDGRLVIASGYGGLILRSTDGGETFTQAASGVTGDLWGLQVINDTLAWASGTNNSLIKTTDGGVTWQRVLTPGYTSDYWWIDFLNKDYGFIAGSGKALKTTDGGVNWETLQAGDGYPLFTIDVIDSLHIAAAGYGGLNYSAKNIYSSDGGNSWTDGQQISSHPINCIKYTAVDTGYIVMEDIGVWKTTDRGTHWSGVGSVGDYEISLIEESHTGYNAGKGLKLYKSEGDYEHWKKTIINEDFSDIFFTTEQKGFAISGNYNGKLFRTDDGGLTWHEAVNGPWGGTIYFIDSLTGFIGSYDSRIFKTTDGGESWYPTNGITNIIAKIQFITPQLGWAAGGYRVFKTTDGGENWNEQIALSDDHFSNLFMIDTLNGWATSRYLYQTTDGGEHWIERNDIPTFFGTDVYFQDTIGYTIEQLNLYKSTDNGNSWFNQIASQYVIRTFGWLTSSHGFIMGDAVYETIDSGKTWIESLSLRNIGLRKLQSPVAYAGYSSGYKGLIYRYVDTSYTPVELTNFTASIEGNDILLRWTTATEINNSGFEVLRSTDKNNWEMIKFVKGNGTTTSRNNYRFSDNLLNPGTYFYRLKQINYDLTYSYSNTVSAIVSNPLTYNLYQNYPNPFNPTTQISFDIAKEGNVKIKLYDITGREVKILLDKDLDEGHYVVSLDASGLSTGVYFCRLSAGNYNSSIKIILLK